MKNRIFLLLVMLLSLVVDVAWGQRQMENLDRGLVAMQSGGGVFLSWRILGTEFSDVSYNIYRNSALIASISATAASNYTDASGTASATYYIRAVVGGVEQPASPTATVWSANYKDVVMDIPAGGTTPDGVAYTYSPNDCSVGDVDGDGQYELIVKWDPSNSKDNANAGYTGNVFIDAYTLSGTRLWRIDLGINIRAGAHYTQLLVYDFNGDGRAEVVCKTAPGTKAGNGSFLSNGPAAGDNDASDYRNTSGYILTGPEYLTVFRGSDGVELQTINYEVARGTVSAWGDNYGNRVDRFLACVAYLDGVRPSIVMCRGYYTRTYLVAYNWNGSALSKLWAFDTNTSGNSGYAGQGNHNLAVGDVDNDGFDEIVYGSMCVDHNGTGKYTTSLGHGDAMHLGDLDPSRPGLEVWACHESPTASGNRGATFRDANTGAIIFSFARSSDTGRAMAADLDSAPGVEVWSAGASPTYTSTGSILSTSQPGSVNFGTWWDGDEYRELMSDRRITKGLANTMLLDVSATLASNNSTKATPNLSGDVFGDWREEVIWRTTDNTRLRIYTTDIATSRRMYTLMHDKMYRLGIAWQNVAYNQPPHLSFFLGNGMGTPPTPNITLVGQTSNLTVSPSSLSYAATSGSHPVTVTSNVGWTASSNQSWLTLSTANGSGNGTVTATASANTGSSSRNATITISSGSITHTVNVTQSGTAVGNITLNIEENTTGYCNADGTIDSNHTGFTGTGFVNTSNANGAGITWSVNVPSTGTYSIVWRYANAGGQARPGTLYVDGAAIVSGISFTETGAWTAWVETPATNVSLSAGNRLIRLQATISNGLANIDRISITGISPTPVSCTAVDLDSHITATEDIDEINRMVYPNPVDDRLEISLPELTQHPCVVNIHNNAGAIILTTEVSSSRNFIDVSKLPSGFYVVKVMAGRRIINKKIIKK